MRSFVRRLSRVARIWDYLTATPAGRPARHARLGLTALEVREVPSIAHQMGPIGSFTSPVYGDLYLWQNDDQWGDNTGADHLTVALGGPYGNGTIYPTNQFGGTPAYQVQPGQTLDYTASGLWRYNDTTSPYFGPGGNGGGAAGPSFIAPGLAKYSLIGILPSPTTMSFGGGSSVAGQPVIFDVQLGRGAAPQAQGWVEVISPKIPTGTVTFYEGSTPIAAANVDANGRVYTTAPTLGVGTHQITAWYNGAYNFAMAAVTQTYTVAPAPTATSLSYSPPNPGAGEAVTFFASVSSAYLTPTGSVVFKVDGGAVYGKPEVTVPLSGGVAAYPSPGLTPGAHYVTATYAGGGNFVGSTSPAAILNLGQTTTTLSSSAAAAVYGQAVTLTATVTAPGGGTPTGTVAFYDRTGFVGTAPVETVNGVSQAVLTVSTLDTLPHSLTAFYFGSATLAASGSSPPVAVAVSPAGTTTTLSAPPGPVAYGQAVTLTATVGPVTPGGTLPGGTVTFYDTTGLFDLGPPVPLQAVNGQMVATLTTTVLGVGAWALVAYYTPDAPGGFPNYTGSASAAVGVMVYAPTTTSLTSSPNTVVYGNTMTLTASVVPSVLGGALAGTVNFYEATSSGDEYVGYASLQSGMGTATLTLSSALSPGVHMFWAQYTGANEYRESVSAQIEDRVLRGTLVTIDSDGEKTDIGWVPLNNDNDNYNFDPAEGETAQTTLRQMIDMDETGEVNGENDLIPIRIQKVEGAVAGDKVSLVFDSANIRIWRSAKKGGLPVGSDTDTFDATQDHVLYVEGVGLSSLIRGERISLKWADGNPAQQTLLSGVEFTVYEVTGAMNVPGYSMYTYTLRSPSEGAVGANFLDTGIGSIAAIDGGVLGGDRTTSNQLGYFTSSRPILWGAGGGNAPATFSMDIADGWRFTREVNVVKIVIDAAGPDNKIAFAQDNVRKSEIVGNLSDTEYGITSLPPDNAQNPQPFIASSLRVTFEANNGRGLRFIEAGWMQTVTVRHQHADFGSVTKRVTSSMEGNTYLDSGTETSPWYSFIHAPSEYRPAGSDLPPPDPDGIVFRTQDSPTTPAADRLKVNGGSATYFSIALDFNTYFVVHTREAVNGSEQAYTVRAEAGWTLDGSGKVLVADNPDNPAAPLFSWDHTDLSGQSLGPVVKGLDGGPTPTSFDEVRDGETVPIGVLTGPLANASAQTITWSVSDAN